MDKITVKKAWRVLQEHYDLRPSALKWLKISAIHAEDMVHERDACGQLGLNLSDMLTLKPEQIEAVNALIGLFVDNRDLEIKTPDSPAPMSGAFTPHELFLMPEEKKEFMKRMIEVFRAGGDIGAISDGDHSYDDLYHQRTILLAALINVTRQVMPGAISSIFHVNGITMWKSRQHADPADPMPEGYFLAGITFCTMNNVVTHASWHCQNKYWSCFDAPELDNAPEQVTSMHRNIDWIETVFCDNTGTTFK